MTQIFRHYHILDFPPAASLCAARLDNLFQVDSGIHRELVIEYHELRLTAPLTWVESSEIPCEAGQGVYLPRRLRFRGIQMVECQGLYEHPDQIPLDHDARILQGVLPWKMLDGKNFYVLFNRSIEPADLMFAARGYQYKELSGPEEPVTFVRTWSPPPPLTAGLIPNPLSLHTLFAGDPVTIYLDRKAYHRRLFVGGLEFQTTQRPAVDAILNLSEEANPWVKDGHPDPADRWTCKGEGRKGMDANEMTQEAHWVINRLLQNQRVLVHCSAGLNRSVSICCAVLILLENISAEVALERVRQRHPWARPDSQHWITLRWLAHKQQNHYQRS